MTNPNSEPEGATAVSCPVVVIAASAGGCKALGELLDSLPVGFATAIAVAQHRSVDHPNLLIKLLRERTVLPVQSARDGDLLMPGTVYLCPAGMHMMADQTLRIFEGPKLNHVRPSADLIFMSLARTHGPRAIGIVLSGTGTDGAIGCKAIVDAGGTVIAQAPESADYPSMPAAAASLGPAQFVLAPGEMGAALEEILERIALNGGSRQTASFGGSEKEGATKVLLADDHRIVLDGLRALLNGERDLAVLSRVAEDGRSAVRLSAELAPDVVVMDLAMPGLDGVSATRKILAQNPAAKVIALSAHTDSRTTLRALRAGASAVLSKQKAFDELATAIRSVMSGHRYISRRGQPAAETAHPNAAAEAAAAAAHN